MPVLLSATSECVACASVCMHAAKHSRQGNQLLTRWVVVQSFSVVLALIRSDWINVTCRISSENRVILQGVISQTW